MRLTLVLDFFKYRKCSSLTGKDLKLLQKRSEIIKLDEEIRSHLSVASGKCDIRLVTTPTHWSHVHSLVSRDLARLPILGLDCEWVEQKGRTSPPLLLQLSSVSGLCVLVRLCQMTSIPASLMDLMARRDVYKVGVGVMDDKSRLKSHHKMNVAKWVDIRHLVVNHWTDPGKLGLESLASHILGVKMDKDWRIKASDWGADTLTQRPGNYAPNDALVGLNMTWVILSDQLTRTLSENIRHDDTILHRELTENVSKIMDSYAGLEFRHRKKEKT